jgi:hypothetical protein
MTSSMKPIEFPRMAIRRRSLAGFLGASSSASTSKEKA